MDNSLIMVVRGDNYSVAADIATVCISLMNWLLVTTTYTKKQVNLKLFHGANAMVTLAALTSMLYHTLVSAYSETQLGIFPYVIHSVMYILLGATYVFYFYYIRNLISLEKSKTFIFQLSVFIPFVILILVKIFAPVTKIGLYYHYSEVEDDLVLRFLSEPFRLLYLYDNFMMVVILYTYRRKFITKMLQCIVEAASLSWIIVWIQDLFKQTSFTCLSFIFPIEAVLFLYHYSSYDMDTGTLDAQAFDSYIHDSYGMDLTLVSLTLDRLEQQKMTETLSQQFYHFNEKYFVDSIIFRVKSNVLVMILDNEKNKNCQNKIEEMLQDFRSLYMKFMMDFKIVIMQSDSRLEDGTRYTQLDDFLKYKTKLNSVRYCKDEDLEEFFKNVDIVSELKDISEKNNLLDERVKVYCQPILDTNSKNYNTAEALMRIDLKEKGMIYPDIFIPMLENFELIHKFTLIILSKTCLEVSRLLEEGYQLGRVTINISMQELKNKNLCDEIIGVIEKYNIPYEKIGIELTESMNDFDYENSKYAIERLKKYNIKIYLDDFGVGYSNMSRILKLPFDVIKFDRSLTIASGENEQSYFIVDNFAKIFKKGKYHVLFEGVENIKDEERCIAMGADMLQGYAYSKPIPIEKLRTFLYKNPTY